MLNVSGDMKTNVTISKHARWNLELPAPVAIDGPWQEKDVALFLEHVYLEASNDTWESYWSGLPDIVDDIMLRCWLRQHRLASFFSYTEMAEAIEFYLGSVLLDRLAKQQQQQLINTIHKQRLSQYITFLLQACLEVIHERATLFLRTLAWALSILPSLESHRDNKAAVINHWRAFALEHLHVNDTTMAGLAYDSTCFVICPKCLENPLIVPDKPPPLVHAGDDTCCLSLLTDAARIKHGGSLEKKETTNGAITRFALSGSANQAYPTTLVYMNMTPFTKSQTIPVTYEYLDAHHGLMHQQLTFKSNDYFPAVTLSFGDNGITAPRLHHGRCMHCQKTQPVHAIFARQVADSTIHAA
jgi:hypothetical protein